MFVIYGKTEFWIGKILLSIFLILSLYTVHAQDTTSVGVEIGYEFTYDFSNTISPEDGVSDPQLFYVKDNNGDKIYPKDGQSITFTIESLPSATDYVVFKIETSDGSVRIKDKSDKYGQVLLFTDWEYWASEITNDTNLFDYGEDVTLINNSTHFGTYHSIDYNASYGDSFMYFSFVADFIYDKQTGMLNDLSIDSYTQYSNGTIDGYEYGISILSQKLEKAENTSISGLTIFIIIVLIGGLLFFYQRRKSGISKNGNTLPYQQQYYQQQQNPQFQYQQPVAPQTLFCEACGKALKPNNKFCTGCGNRTI